MSECEQHHSSSRLPRRRLPTSTLNDASNMRDANALAALTLAAVVHGFGTVPGHPVSACLAQLNECIASKSSQCLEQFALTNDTISCDKELAVKELAIHVAVESVEIAGSVDNGLRHVTQECVVQLFDEDKGKRATKSIQKSGLVHFYGADADHTCGIWIQRGCSQVVVGDHDGKFMVGDGCHESGKYYEDNVVVQPFRTTTWLPSDVCEDVCGIWVDIFPPSATKINFVDYNKIPIYDVFGKYFKAIQIEGRSFTSGSLKGYCPHSGAGREPFCVDECRINGVVVPERKSWGDDGVCDVKYGCDWNSDCSDCKGCAWYGDDDGAGPLDCARAGEHNVPPYYPLPLKHRRRLGYGTAPRHHCFDMLNDGSIGGTSWIRQTALDQNEAWIPVGLGHVAGVEFDRGKRSIVGMGLSRMYCDGRCCGAVKIEAHYGDLTWPQHTGPSGGWVHIGDVQMHYCTNHNFWTFDPPLKDVRALRIIPYGLDGSYTMPAFDELQLFEGGLGPPSTQALTAVPSTRAFPFVSGTTFTPMVWPWDKAGLCSLSSAGLALPGGGQLYDQIQSSQTRAPEEWFKDLRNIATLYTENVGDSSGRAYFDRLVEYLSPYSTATGTNCPSRLVDGQQSGPHSFKGLTSKIVWCNGFGTSTDSHCDPSRVETNDYFYYPSTGVWGHASDSAVAGLLFSYPITLAAVELSGVAGETRYNPFNGPTSSDFKFQVLLSPINLFDINDGGAALSTEALPWITIASSLTRDSATTRRYTFVPTQGVRALRVILDAKGASSKGYSTDALSCGAALYKGIVKMNDFCEQYVKHAFNSLDEMRAFEL